MDGTDPIYSTATSTLYPIPSYFDPILYQCTIPVLLWMGNVRHAGYWIE